MSHGRCQAIVWTIAGTLLIRILETGVSQILSEIHTFSIKLISKLLSKRWQPFCLILNVSSCMSRPTYNNRVSNFKMSNANPEKSSACLPGKKPTDIKWNSVHQHADLSWPDNLYTCLYWYWVVQHFIFMYCLYWYWVIQHYILMDMSMVILSGAAFYLYICHWPHIRWGCSLYFHVSF